MQFTELLQTMKSDGDDSLLTVPDDWLQGRTVFGGLQTAAALKVMRTLVPAAMPLRTLQTIFIAPGQTGTLRVQAKVLRTSKNTCHVEARLVEGAQVLAIIVGVFGMARPSAIRRTPQQPAVSSATPVELRFIPGYTPNFIQHFKATFLRGGLPFSGSKVPEAVVDLAMLDSGMASELHVVALADFIPPLALTMLSAPAPGSSLTWALEFLTDSVTQHPLSGWRVDAEMISAGDGFTNQSVMLWGPGGAPVALSRQSMVVFG